MLTAEIEPDYYAEYVGTIPLADDPASSISKLPIAEKLRVKEADDVMRIYLYLGSSILQNKPIKELLSPEVAGNVWKQVIAAADNYYHTKTVSRCRRRAATTRTSSESSAPVTPMIRAPGTANRITSGRCR